MTRVSVEEDGYYGHGNYEKINYDKDNIMFVSFWQQPRKVKSHVFILDVWVVT